MEFYYRFQWLQRKSRNNFRSPSLEAENLISTYTVLLTFSKNLSNLSLPWETLLYCYQLVPFLFLPTSRAPGFLPAALSFIWGHSLRPWSTGKEVNCLICTVASTHGLLPLVKHLALSQERTSSDKILQTKTGFALAAVHYLWTPAMLVLFILHSWRNNLIKEYLGLHMSFNMDIWEPLFIPTV